MTTTLTYPDRFLLALDYLRLRYQQRDGFLSDSDLMDASERWTTEQPDEPGFYSEDGDWQRLLNALYGVVFPAEG